MVVVVSGWWWIVLDVGVSGSGVTVNDWASTLQTDVFAMPIALEHVEATATDSLVILDSMSSLLVLDASEAR